MLQHVCEGCAESVVSGVVNVAERGLKSCGGPVIDRAGEQLFQALPGSGAELWVSFRGGDPPEDSKSLLQRKSPRGAEGVPEMVRMGGFGHDFSDECVAEYIGFERTEIFGIAQRMVLTTRIKRLEKRQKVRVVRPVHLFDELLRDISCRNSTPQSHRSDDAVASLAKSSPRDVVREARLEGFH